LINLSGALGLRSVPQTSNLSVQESEDEDEARSDDGDDDNHHHAHEDTPLLHSSSVRHHESLLSLFQDIDFWSLGLLMLICMGMSEMVMSNIGTIIASFDLPPTQQQLNAGPQIRLLSFSNTISRLLIGLIADIVSPIPTKGSDNNSIFSRTRVVSRTAFVWLSCLVLLVSFCWMGFGVRSPDELWSFSLGTGAAYGMIWTVIPSLVECIWGPKHVGRNFGTICYTPFLGTPIFTLLYAFFSDRARGRGRGPGPSPLDPICRGINCWRPTFQICTGVLCGAMVVATVLWRRWRDRV